MGAGRRAPKDLKQNLNKRKPIHPTTACHTCDAAFSRCCCAATASVGEYTSAAAIDDKDELSRHVEIGRAHV